jgi:hypothetical protein
VSTVIHVLVHTLYLSIDLPGYTYCTVPGTYSTILQLCRSYNSCSMLNLVDIEEHYVYNKVLKYRTAAEVLKVKLPNKNADNIFIVINLGS